MFMQLIEWKFRGITYLKEVARKYGIEFSDALDGVVRCAKDYKII